MVDWTSPQALARDSDAYSKLLFAIFGLYLWELFQTSGFEWSLITRRRKFAWPMILFVIVLVWINNFAVNIYTGQPEFFINCQALYTFNSWAGNMAILCASTSLMLRTIALWQRQLKIVIPLGALCLAHWALLWRGMFVITAQYDPTQDACEVVSSNHIFLNISFFMTMCFDFVILAFTLAALMPRKTESGLWKLLFTDGLVYFLVTFICNMFPAILNVLDLNVVMNVVATVPAATFSAIAACRAVIRLQDYKTQDIYIHSAAQMMSNAPTSGMTPGIRASAFSGRSPPTFMLTRPEVLVTTDHIIMEDFECESSPEFHEHKTDPGTFDDRPSCRSSEYIATAV